MRIENKIVRIKFKDADKVQILNQEAIGSIKAEHKLLYVIKDTLQMLDGRDGIIGNEPIIKHCQKILSKAIDENRYQHVRDCSEKMILDNVIPLFPEWITDEAS